MELWLRLVFGEDSQPVFFYSDVSLSPVLHAQHMYLTHSLTPCTMLQSVYIHNKCDGSRPCFKCDIVISTRLVYRCSDVARGHLGCVFQLVNPVLRHGTYVAS